MDDKKIMKRRIPSSYIDSDDFHLECPNYEFIPTVLPAKKAVIAIGDIHGDLNLAILSLKLAGVIDDKYEWVANPPDTVVIQVGDQVDSCRFISGVNDCRTKIEGNKGEDMLVLDFFNKMHAKASKKGGAVYSLLGNHELMNVENDFRYVSYEDYYNFNYEINGQTFEGPHGREEAFAPGGEVSKMLACTRNSVMIIGSNMFVHAGVLPKLIESIQDVDFDSHAKLVYLNDIVRKWLLNKLSEKNSEKTNAEIILGDRDKSMSPFWTRIFGQIKPEMLSDIGECSNIVKKTLQVFKIGKLVVGHTPQLFVHGVGINGTCFEKGQDGNLWRVDGGFSKGFSVFGSQNIIQVLKITDDTNFKVLTQTIDGFVKPKLSDTFTDNNLQKVGRQFSQGRISPEKKNKKRDKKKID